MKRITAYLVEPKKIELREDEITINDDQVLIQVKACGLCPWELNHWHGKMGFNIPIGHEGVGVIVETGKNVRGFKAGDAVTGGIGGFTQYIATGTGCLFKLNDDIQYAYGFVEPLKCVATVIRNTAPAFGETGVVLGCGPMGLGCVQALRGNLLANLIAVDVAPRNLELARQFGATHTINPKETNVLEAINEITGGRRADFVIEGTGSLKLFQDSLGYVRKFGRITVMSSYEGTVDGFDFSRAIDNGLHISVAHGSDRFDDWTDAVGMINRGVFDLREIVTHKFKLDDINAAFGALEHKPEGYLKGVVIP